MSLVSYVPKNKHYSGTGPLLAQVGVMVACQVIEFAVF